MAQFHLRSAPPGWRVPAPVNNRLFWNYRERTQMGSDFLVYSDIGYIETNDEFLV